MLAKAKWIQYQDPFLRPLKTAHGIWTVRQGIYLRLESETGEIGFGEIAPLPEFGSETIATACHFCHDIPPLLTSEWIKTIPETLPASQFGFSQAWASLLNFPRFEDQPLPESGLLPAGGGLLKYSWQSDGEKYQAWKWKIATLPLESELEILRTWLNAQPLGQLLTLRLDANGGLTFAEAQAWLAFCDQVNAEYAQGQTMVKIEFLEQPLPPANWLQLQALSQQFQTPIALDESVSSLASFMAVISQGWPGLLVVKPLISGAWDELVTLLPQYRQRIILSSVFEGAIGRWGIHTLARQLSLTNYALGIGVGAWRPVPQLLNLPELEAFWQSLIHSNGASLSRF